MNPIQPLVNWLIGVFTIVKVWIRPILVIFLSLVTPVTLLISAVADPMGWVNQSMINIIDWMFAVLPVTPEALKITNLMTAAYSSANVPALGQVVINEILTVLGTIVTIDLVFKVWKLLPFT